MPKVYKKDCEHCGTYYESWNERFCSKACYGAFQRGELPGAPGEQKATDPAERQFEKRGKPPKLQAPTFTEDTEIDAHAASCNERVTTIEQLLAVCEIDTSVWEVRDAVVETWEGYRKDKKVDLEWRHGSMTGTVKDSGELATKTLYLVKVWLRKKMELYAPQPIILRITRPSAKKPSAAPTTSVHYGDAHFPYHDPRALNVLYQILDYTRPYLVVDHGDLLDCEQISKFLKDPFNRVGLNDEIQMGAEHLGTVHAITPEAEHRWYEGNHEDRLRKQVWKMSEDRRVGEVLLLPGVKEQLEWGRLLGIGDLGWKITPYAEHDLLNDRLILKHGQEVRKESGQTAKAEHDKYAKSGMSGHTHRLASYHRRDHNGQHAWWELGMLGAISDHYTEHPNWQQGLAVVTWSDDLRSFGVELVAIHEGVAYFRGQRFVGDSTGFGELAVIQAEAA